MRKINTIIKAFQAKVLLSKKSMMAYKGIQLSLSNNDTFIAL